jgi:AcrR family transcriptional regulator
VGGKREANRRQRTEALRQAALPLFLSRGIEGVSIDDIVQSAGSAKGSFYRYFADKADLVRSLLEPVAQRMEAAFTTCEESLRAATQPEQLVPAYESLAGEMAAVAIADPEVVRLYLQEGRAPAVEARAPVGALAVSIRRGALRLTEAAHHHGLLKPIDPRVSATVTVGAVERILFGLLSGEDLGNPVEIPGALISLLLDGIRAIGPQQPTEITAHRTR